MVLQTNGKLLLYMCNGKWKRTRVFPETSFVHCAEQPSGQVVRGLRLQPDDRLRFCVDVAAERFSAGSREKGIGKQHPVQMIPTHAACHKRRDDYKQRALSTLER
jgi:hypothetical protein